MKLVFVLPKLAQSFAKKDMLNKKYLSAVLDVLMMMIPFLLRIVNLKKFLKQAFCCSSKTITTYQQQKPPKPRYWI